MYFLRISPTEVPISEKSFRIAHPEPEVTEGIYCWRRQQEFLENVIAARTEWEDWIIIKALIKKGALLPKEAHQSENNA